MNNTIAYDMRDVRSTLHDLCYALGLTGIKSQGWYFIGRHAHLIVQEADDQWACYTYFNRDPRKAFIDTANLPVR